MALMADIKQQLLRQIAATQTLGERMASDLAALKSYVEGFDAISDGAPATAPRKPFLGWYYESIFHNPVPRDAARMLRKIFSKVMYRFPWPRFERRKGAMNWAALDRDIATLASEGFEIILARHGVPAWATVEKKPTHEIYEDSCMKLQPYGAYADDREHCQNPAHVEPAAMFDLGRQLALRYGDRIAMWCAGPNEPGQDIYNPWWWAARNGKITEADAVRFTVAEQTEPLTAGVRDIFPDATLIGPEADSGGILRLYLEYERANNLRLYDIIGTHIGYSWDRENGFPIEHGYERIEKELLPVLNEYGNGRENWLTEWGERHEARVRGRQAEFARQALAYPFVSALFIHATGSGWAGLLREEAGKYVPTSAYAALQELNAELIEQP